VAKRKRGRGCRRWGRIVLVLPLLGDVAVELRDTTQRRQRHSAGVGQSPRTESVAARGQQRRVVELSPGRAAAFGHGRRLYVAGDTAPVAARTPREAVRSAGATGSATGSVGRPRPVRGLPRRRRIHPDELRSRVSHVPYTHVRLTHAIHAHVYTLTGLYVHVLFAAFPLKCRTANVPDIAPVYRVVYYVSSRRSVSDKLYLCHRRWLYTINSR